MKTEKQNNRKEIEKDQRQSRKYLITKKIYMN